jgi:antirestriction protein ArdC
MNNYEAITNAIIELLKDGKIPWKRPWRGSGVPQSNFISKKPYHGINAMMTAIMSYHSPYWMTFNQIRKYEKTKLKLRKGSKGVPIIFSKWIEGIDDDGKAYRYPVVKRSTIFNLTQIEGISCPEAEKYNEKEDEREVNAIPNAEKLLKDIKSNHCKIIHDDRLRACYVPQLDVIKVTTQDGFVSDESYYSTLFHEIIHSTGHSSRLDRPMGGTKRSASYAKEELIAEIGSSFLNAECGILDAELENSAAYIQSWIKRLKNDHHLIIKASSMAEKAVKYLKTGEK